MNALLDVLLRESSWPAFALLTAALTVGIGWRRRREEVRRRIVWAMSLFHGLTVAVMAFGHLFAVTVNALRGTLEGSLVLLVLLGVVLLVPSGWLVLAIGRWAKEESSDRRIVAVNAASGLCLVAMGPHNLPLAMPAFLNVAYVLTTRRLVGWVIVSITAAGSAALLVGSLVFLVSGQSFEEFSGME